MSPDDRKELTDMMKSFVSELETKIAEPIRALDTRMKEIAVALDKARADPDGVSVPREDIAADDRAAAIEAANPRVLE